MLVGKVEASNSVVRSMPDSPASKRFQTSSMECPIGVIHPIPVMTTRFILPFLPLPPGEGGGEGAFQINRFSLRTPPHPNPLPKGEGTRVRPRHTFLNT